MKIIIVAIAAFFLLGCIRNTPSEGRSMASIADTTKVYTDKCEINYAQGFTINYFPSHKEICVKQPGDTSKILAKYILTKKGRAFTFSSDAEIIYIPISKIACVSTTHLPFLLALQCEESLVGFGGIKYIKNPIILDRVKAGKIKEIGFDHAIDVEGVINLEPDALMVYPYEGMNFNAIKKAGISIIYNAEYLETHPLGKSEWIKFLAAFYNKEAEANLVFHKIEQEYKRVQNTALSSKNYPSVFSGKAFKGEWHVPGGKSFAAAFINDAHANYLWKDNEDNNVIALNFEEVMEAAIDADWWLIVGAHVGEYTLNDLIAEDPRYENFKAVKNKQVIYCNTLQVDYFGDGVIQPELILADLVHYFHPELRKKYSPHYFFKLK